MEQNIDSSIESDAAKGIEDSDSTKLQEEEEENVLTEEVKERREFKIEMQKILQKLKELPTEIEELPTVVPVKTSKDIYLKLCTALKVRVNSAFIAQLEDEKMDLSYQCLGPNGIIPIAKALCSCKAVKILDLKYNKLGLRGLPLIKLLIDQNEHIVHLNLSGNEMGKESAEWLGKVISRCFSVDFLDLSNNNLGDEELEEIGLAMMEVDNVKELFLNSNDFSSEKAQVFGSCINKCTELTTLDISSCHLEEGAMHIFSKLRTSNLTYLNLARNVIPDEAMSALASGLRANKSLKKLDISYNVITNKGALVLAPGLKSSSTLEIMILAHNPFQGSAATKLLTSAGGNLKLLDLTGIRVDLGFYKTLSAYAKFGRELQVLFGSEVRYNLLSRDLSTLDDEQLSEDSVVPYLQRLADEKGISLRNTLKSIHAAFISNQLSELVAENADTQKRPEMTTEEFARDLAGSALAVPKVKVKEVAELLSQEGIVNMWKLIGKIKWKPDDLNVKIKEPKTSKANDKKKDKGKTKK